MRRTVAQGSAGGEKRGVRGEEASPSGTARWGVARPKGRSPEGAGAASGGSAPSRPERSEHEGESCRESLDERQRANEGSRSVTALYTFGGAPLGAGRPRCVMDFDTRSVSFERRDGRCAEQVRQEAARRFALRQRRVVVDAMTDSTSSWTTVRWTAVEQRKPHLLYHGNAIPFVPRASHRRTRRPKQPPRQNSPLPQNNSLSQDTHITQQPLGNPLPSCLNTSMSQ